MKRSVRYITWAAIIAALYVILTMALAPIAFGMIQFRLSEALTVLPMFTPAAIPGIILGCLLSNLLNPQNLGPIDIFLGTAASGLAAYFTFLLGRRYKRVKKSASHYEQRKITWARVMALFPPVLLNALIVGFYLPFLLAENITINVVLLSMLSIFVSQTVVVYAIGLPIVFGIERTPLALLMEDV